jgi:hypothetical protein
MIDQYSLGPEVGKPKQYADDRHFGRPLRGNF